MRDRARLADVPQSLPQAALHRAGGRLLQVESHQGAEGEAALRRRDEGRCDVRHCRHLGEGKEPASGEWLRTFVIITTDPNELVADIHDRMPLILAPRDYARWLGAELMRMWPISTRVNKPENDDPSIVESIELATDAA